jgi:hypothetical protein
VPEHLLHAAGLDDRRAQLELPLDRVGKFWAEGHCKTSEQSKFSLTLFSKAMTRKKAHMLSSTTFQSIATKAYVLSSPVSTIISTAKSMRKKETSITVFFDALNNLISLPAVAARRPIGSRAVSI